MPKRLPFETSRAEKPRGEQFDFQVECFARDEWERQRNRTGRHWQTWHLRIGSKVLQVSFSLLVACVTFLACAFLAQSAPRAHGIAIPGCRILLVQNTGGSNTSSSMVGQKR